MANELNRNERREQLHNVFLALVDNVYFQPPNNLTLVYPCIVYSRGRASSEFADNTTYRYTKQYDVTVIDLDPNSEIPDKVAMLPTTTHERWFAVDNLNHDVFSLYF